MGYTYTLHHGDHQNAYEKYGKTILKNNAAINIEGKDKPQIKVKSSWKQKNEDY